MTKAVSPAFRNGRNHPHRKAGEFYLLTGKVAQYTQIGTQNNQLLHKYADEPRLWMNAQTAESLGLADGDRVEVTSTAGKIHIKLLATQAIRPDCVYLTPGFRASLQGPDHRLWRRRQRL